MRARPLLRLALLWPVLALAEAPPPDCDGLSKQALAVDLRVAQTPAAEVATRVRLLDEAIALWQQAVPLCSGRALQRAQRNLADNQRQRKELGELAGAGEACTAPQRDGQAMQQLAERALAESRFDEAARLFRKAESLYDVAAERCSGNAQAAARQQRDRLEVDAHNAEFCAPRFERAREQGQRWRGVVSAAAPAAQATERERQLQQLETLWREAVAHCKEAAAELARGQAQGAARERGTAWVATLPAPATPAPPATTPAATPATSPASTPATPAAAPAAPRPAPAPSRPATPPQTPAATPAPEALDIQLPDGTRLSGLLALDPATQRFSGRGRVVMPNGDRYEGDLVNGHRQGQGEGWWTNGMHFKGQWQQDHPHGQGTLRFPGGNVWEGEIERGVPHGKGRMVYASGDVYRGPVNQGLPEGTGEYLWANGQRYEGPWVQGKARGQGTMHFANGNHYTGPMEDGQPQGVGRMRYASGDSYEGGFDAGTPHGKGSYTWRSGQRFEGQFVHGVPTGQGLMRYANGNRYEGPVLEGQPHGQGRMQFASGDVFEGQFERGLPHGEGRYQWTNGDRYVGAWQAGQREGQGVFTWANGDRWSGRFRNSEMTDDGRLERAPGR